ncbi:MAG: serine hydrolase [Gammaproteobacteria bacterium]|nr:serine hydrolase [Gammaproteobacteria bacterium]
MPAKKNLASTIVMLLSVFAIALPSSADTANPPYRLPGGAAPYDDPFIAAGFRALFTCSAHFWAGRPLTDIVDIELLDTAPLGLPLPEIDATRRLVSAADGEGRTRIAAFRDSMGCTLLPPHWSEADIPKLPYVSLPPIPDMADKPFPQGDKARPRPNRSQKALLKKAFDGTTYGDGTITAGVVLIKDGEIIAESYRPGFGIHSGYRTWSTAKSVSASLIAIAVKQGLLDLDQPAPVPEWQAAGDPRAAITVNHLLWMSSGLWGQGNNTNAVYFGGQDVVSGATTTHLEAAPNSRWKYANNDTLLLLRALRHVLGNDLAYLRYPYDELLHKIGMFHTRMETDHLGNFIGSSQVYTTARDLGRLGLLYLNDGVWQGQRVLPEGWTEFVATPAPSRPPEANVRGYGAQFWLYGTFDGIPAGTYTTAGNKGQLSTIVPEHNLVIVRTGVDPQGHRWNHVQFIRDVLDTLD